MVPGNFSSVRAAWFLEKKLSGFMADLRLCNELALRISLSFFERLGLALDRLEGYVFFLLMYVARDTNSTPG